MTAVRAGEQRTVEQWGRISEGGQQGQHGPVATATIGISGIKIILNLNLGPAERGVWGDQIAAS